MLEASIKDQATGGQGSDTHVSCLTNGMPRVMTATFPIEFVVLPAVTYVHFEAFMPRRIYTDGRQFPKDEEPSYLGYSIGKWIDEDGDGRYDMLEVETRNFKGPRTYENSGLQLHADNQSILKERIFLDKTNPDILHDEFTVIDHALTRPWTTTKSYRRDRNVLWVEDNCPENNNHVVVGKENYFLSADGFLMPTKKKPAATGPALLQGVAEVARRRSARPVVLWERNPTCCIDARSPRQPSPRPWRSPSPAPRHSTRRNIRTGRACGRGPGGSRPSGIRPSLRAGRSSRR